MSYIDLQPQKNENTTTESLTDNKVEIPTENAESIKNEEKLKNNDKIIDLTEGKAEDIKTATAATKGNIPKEPPTRKVPDINFDVFVPRIKQLKGKNIESFSDEEIVGLALNKLTCDSYKSLKGVENTPAIACWLYLYNTVNDEDVKLARAICNLKKDFPGAMKYMLEQIKKKGNGGYDHNELFELVYKYYFAKEKPKKETSAAKAVKTPATAKATADKTTVSKKENTAKPAKAKKEVKKVEKKDEPLQLSLLM